MKRTAPAATPDASRIPRVNLLPESARLHLAMRQRLRYWAMAVGVGIGLTLASAHWARHAGADVASERRALADVRQRTRTEEKRILALSARADALRKQEALLAGMRAPQSWSRIVAGVALATPANVVVTRVHAGVGQRPVDAPAESGRPPARSGAAPRPAAPPPLSEALIEGVAENHQALAAFLDQLHESKHFREVALLRSVAGAEPAGGLRFAIAGRR